MQDFIIEIINQFGYLGILLLIALENLFPPIPSEVILAFAGFMTTYSNMNIPGVVLASTAGSLIGAVMLYGIGRLLSPQKLERLLASRWGRALHFRKEDVSRAVSWFSRKGSATVFFCRFIPIVRSLISIPAGVTKMPLGKFLGLSAAGTLIWNTVLVSLGALAGSSWENIVSYAGFYSELILAVLLVFFILFALYYYKKRIKRTNKKR